MTTEVLIYSGLASGALAFVSSIIATFHLYRASNQQQELVKRLQDERLAFDQEAAKNLEAYRSDLSKQKVLFEADLKRREDFYSQQVSNLFAATERSQEVIRQTLDRFSTMVERSRSLKDGDFLDEFSKSIVAFNAFNDSTRSLENMLRKKDAKYIGECRAIFLEILLGMRLEEERRQKVDFLSKISGYQNQLKSMKRVLGIKYRRVLQPRMPKLR